MLAKPLLQLAPNEPQVWRLLGEVFLGFGAAPPAAEWGTLIADGRNYLVTAWWLSLLPGLFVALIVLSLNHISKTLQELTR